MSTPSLAEVIALLPCPFCGKPVMFRKALFVSDGCTDAIIHAAPGNCGMHDFCTDTTDGSVITAWNKRAATLPGEDWVLVPREPTEQMVVDGFESEPDPFFSTPEEWDAYESMSGCRRAAHRARLCWAAMIAAARTSAASLRDEDARDAARYRWLEQNADVEYTDEDGNGWIYSPTDSKLTSLSTRIDTAITATQPAAQERQA